MRRLRSYGGRRGPFRGEDAKRRPSRAALFDGPGAPPAERPAPFGGRPVRILAARAPSPPRPAMAGKTLFQKIADREIPATLVHEDDRCIAFRDIDPKAPTHLLVVPRKPIPSLDDLEEEDAALVGHLFVVARRLAEAEGLTGGYRTVFNCGPDAGQSVDHLHLHVLGGRALSWPPG